MNDSQVMVAAFEGGRLFEQRVRNSDGLSPLTKRISHNTILRLHDSVVLCPETQDTSDNTILLEDYTSCSERNPARMVALSLVSLDCFSKLKGSGDGSKLEDNFNGEMVIYN